MSGHLALYGNVKMARAFCESCHQWALVIQGEMGCCGAKVSVEILTVKRMTQPEQARRLPPMADRRRVLDEQDHRCLYCLRRFGTFVMRRNRPVRVKLVWDHVAPFAYGQNNQTPNFAAACSICNGYKAAHVYHTIEEARLAIQTARERGGYEDL